MRRSPSLSGPTKQSESSGHPPSAPMAAFGAWLEVRGRSAGALFRRAVRGGRGGERRLAWPLSHRTACGAPLSPRERDAGADLATVQKMVGRESVTTTAGYDRRGNAARGKAADLVHVPFFPRQD
jgi:hypothetical protein